MAGIVGTITNLSDFLSKTQVCLSVKPNDPQQQIICLEADRKYSIPAFQREVRWDDNNLKMLLYDLSRSSKFLGNIILTIKSDHTCEIIDGQQRTTVLMLIVSCIKKKFGTKISTPDLCPLRNEGFTGFQTLLEKAFDQEAITSDDWNAILKSDDYHQFPRIQKLWNTISSSELLADRHKAQGLLDNLCKSEFNIIASYSNDVNTSIQYFLDVNLKGIRLDTEDIFKGYLFSQDSREITRSLWQKNKRDVLRLNGVTQSSEEKRYPLMKLYEHFFYCDLYLPREGDCEYSTLKFGENFCLTSGFESGSTKYYEGSHLIEAIRDRDYLQNVLSRLNKCVEIMTDIIESEGPSTPFKDKFICAKKVDSIDIQNCHSMLKKILMEKEVIPKILALKYILTYFDGKPHAKEEYKSVYSVFCAAVLFTVFANKKESDTFYNFVRLEEWKSKINKWLYDYISSHALTRGKVLAAYKYSESDDDPIQQIRCKSLAAISNFFKVTKNGDNYNMGISNAAELCKFFGDKTVYSLEHFIVGECGTLHVKTAKYDFPYKYPPTIQKYRNSLFNFIFIPQPLNSSLSNEGLFIKVEKEKQRQELDKSYEKLNQEKNDILKEQQKNRGEIDVKITSILGIIKSPYLLSESLCARMFELGNSMKKLKLPKTIAKDFFTELASADRCVCDRCIGERERTAILKRADQYLGSDQQSVLNMVKSSLMDSVYDERLKKAFEELEELRAQANRLDTRFKTNEEKLIKAGGEKARELQERIEELIRLISIARDELERIESKDENDASLTEENNLHKADQKFKYYEQEIAKATRTNTALRKKELVDSLVNEIKLQATTALKQEIVRKTNEKLRRVIVDDYVEIESIDRYIKLKGRDGASEGQTLSIAYCFLGTLFEDSELEFPFIIDSPTGKMDFEKRQAVADIIPLVFNQMIAFVQSAEVERFADRFYANPDSQYLTVVASPQDQAVVVYEGIDFFDSYQREHKGDEK